MMLRNGLFSSESVFECHPDKLADHISDHIREALLECDPNAQIAFETLLADQYVVAAGEFKTNSLADFHAVCDQAEQLSSDVLRQVGYSDAASDIDTTIAKRRSSSTVNPPTSINVLTKTTESLKPGSED